MLLSGLVALLDGPGDGVLLYTEVDGIVSGVDEFSFVELGEREGGCGVKRSSVVHPVWVSGVGGMKLCCC